MQWIEDYIAVEPLKIRDIEASTGHGSWVQGGEKFRSPNTEALAEMSKRTGGSLSVLANISRHVSMAKNLLGYLTTNTESLSGDFVIQSIEKITEAALVLKCQNESAELHVVYLQERGRVQQSVVS